MAEEGHRHKPEGLPGSGEHEVGPLGASGRLPPPEEREDSARMLMQCIDQLLLVAQTKAEHDGDDNDYEAEELFAALRWAMGRELAEGVAAGTRDQLPAACRCLAQAGPSSSACRWPAARGRRCGAGHHERLWGGQKHFSVYWRRGLPLELMESIILLLPVDQPQQILDTRLVCRAWYFADTNQSFWRRMFQRLHPSPPQEEDEMEECWRHRYSRYLYGAEAGTFRQRPLNEQEGKVRPRYGKARGNQTTDGKPRDVPRQQKDQRVRLKRAEYSRRRADKREV